LAAFPFLFVFFVPFAGGGATDEDFAFFDVAGGAVERRAALRAGFVRTKKV